MNGSRVTAGGEAVFDGGAKAGDSGYGVEVYGVDEGSTISGSRRLTTRSSEKTKVITEAIKAKTRTKAGWVRWRSSQSAAKPVSNGAGL